MLIVDEVLYNSIIMTQRQRGKPKKVSPDYIVGLTDGEGCFYINIRSPHKPQSRQLVEHHFYIKLRGDHLELLQKVKTSLGCGAIYRQLEKRENHSECYRFEINSQRDIQEVLIPFFDKYPLQGPKSKEYLIFRQIAILIKNKKHLTNDGLAKIRKLKAKMNLGVRRVWKIRLLGPDDKSGSRSLHRLGNVK